MLFKDFRSFTLSGVVPVLAWEACFYPSCEKYVFSTIVPSPPMTFRAQEYPDRMLATFSILPSPKVSETVVEVSHAIYTQWAAMTNISPAVQRASFGAPTR
jgi:hypothetical protein